MSTKNATNITTSSGPWLYFNAFSFDRTTAATTARAATDGVFQIRKTSSGFKPKMFITIFPRNGKVPTLEGNH